MNWNILEHSMKARWSFALPTVSEEKAREDAFKYLTGLMAPPGTNVKYQRFKMFDNDLSLYFYPIYFVRYSYRDMIFTISVDGVSGKVIAGEVPAAKMETKRNMVKIPLIAAALSVLFPPLPLIILAVLYLIDSLTAEARRGPFEWFMVNAGNWFGAG